MTAKFVDIDGHIMEPADLWLDYIEPKYREHALRISEDEDGLEVSQCGREEVVLRAGRLVGGAGGYRAGREAVPGAGPDLVGGGDGPGRGTSPASG